MSTCECEICIPDAACDLDQDEEWIEIITKEGKEKLRLHDYDRFYEIPGLYDGLYRRLKCQSPVVVCNALKEQMQAAGDDPEPVRALDFGAGNGQVGEYLTKEFDCDVVVGLDILPQAKDAAHRDRPGIYSDYYVTDLSTLTQQDQQDLCRWRFNALVTVAALGYGDIGTQAFANAINLVEDGGWIAFNIKDRFLSEDDDSGFRTTLDSLKDEGFDLVHSHRYRHRYSLTGDPLHYYVMVGRKRADVSID